MNNLTRTGQWLWRDGELSHKTYYELTREQKEEYIKFLLTLKDNELSSTDQIILRFSGVKIKNHFFTLDEEKLF